MRRVRLILYLDDILIINSSRLGVASNFKLLVKTLQMVGFVLNWVKMVVTPCQQIEFLGLLINSLTLTLALKTSTVSKAVDTFNRAFNSHSISLKDIASILGLFSWVISSIPFAQAHYRSLQMQYLNSSKLARGIIKTKLILDSDSRSDLGWWVTNLAQVNGRSFSARAWNPQLPKFVSWRPQPHCWRVNAFNFS